MSVLTGRDAKVAHQHRLHWLVFLNFLWIFGAITMWFYEKAAAAVAEQDWAATRRLEALEQESQVTRNG